MKTQKIKKLHLIFEELRRSIMEGKYKPRELLNERDLADFFGTSRSPIREALRKLESMGMVKLIPNRSARVADYSKKEIEALYLMRKHLEQLSSKLAANSISSKDIYKLTEINKKLENAMATSDYAKIVEENYRFHTIIASLSQNPYLIKMIEELRSRSFPVSYYYWRSAKHARLSIAEHKKIIRAFKNHNLKQLSTVTEKHLEHSKNAYLKYLGEIERLRSY
jgi:DNA-binding GntR family transcriptional regulator